VRAEAHLCDWRPLLLVAAASVPLLCGAGTDPVPAGAPRTEFTPPAAGSYPLQHIQRVGEFMLLDERGGSVRLTALLRGRITLLTFFYTHCADPLGCPLAFGLMHGLRERAKVDPRLAGAQFVSISLDPERDTPALLTKYAAEFAGDRGPKWRFLTGRSIAQLRPLLADFGQDVSTETSEDGAHPRLIHHMLKMFLIDERGSVREIYSLAFMQPAVVLEDLRTLAMASAPRASATPLRTRAAVPDRAPLPRAPRDRPRYSGPP
jgi:cytochrome oxidase Cu insertion factor (SCO1/SenC/PrrC family)